MNNEYIKDEKQKVHSPFHPIITKQGKGLSVPRFHCPRTNIVNMHYYTDTKPDKEQKGSLTLPLPLLTINTENR